MRAYEEYISNRNYRKEVLRKGKNPKICMVKPGDGFNVRFMRAKAVFFRSVGVFTFWLVEEGLELPVAPVCDSVAVKRCVFGKLLL